MIPQDPLPPLLGDAWEEAFDTIPERLVPIASEFIYVNSTTMLFAEPGVGKSMLLAQIALSLTTGIPVFGRFDVPRPLKVYILALETRRSKDAFRVRDMVRKGKLPYDKAHIAWDNSCQRLELLNHNEVEFLKKRITHYMPDVDVIGIDPLYRTTSGDLSVGHTMTSLMTNLAEIRDHFNSSMLLNHHANKGFIGQDGKKHSAYFGSTFIGAGMDTTFRVALTPKGTRFEQEKDRDDEIIKGFDLHYDRITRLSTFADTNPAGTYESEAEWFNSMRRPEVVSMTLEEASASIRKSSKTLRRIIDSGALVDIAALRPVPGKPTMFDLMPCSTEQNTGTGQGGTPCPSVVVSQPIPLSA